MLNSLYELIIRDLQKLKEEVTAFESDAQLWSNRPEVTNSAGNLTLHLCGNLRHFIGHVLGPTSYKRNRDHEFSASGLTKNELVKLIDVTLSEMKIALNADQKIGLHESYPIEVFGKTMTTEAFLLHLYGHLNYHLGQINYYRRLK